MPTIPLRTLALLCALIAGAALATALVSEHWEGLAPCALCLVERWPYRVAIVLGLLAIVVPPRLARILLMFAVAAVLADAVIAFVHVGVEFHWWPSPLPECAAPHISGGTLAEQLASMPAHPAKPCDSPSYLIPGLPVSIAAMDLIFALCFGGLLAIFVWREARTAA
ncbi:MAG TPA: disulfide bond formation protein B [Acetobacteraceae bacterium]|jgi:disulfide bond formation protein DsbB